MDRRTLAASVAAILIGIGGGTALAQTMPTHDQMMKVQHDNMMRAQAQHLVACYGIAAVGKNDCAAGAHSCAGQATTNRDPASFVLLPVGDCGKIAGGMLKAG